MEFCVEYLFCCVVKTEEQPKTDRQMHATNHARAMATSSMLSKKKKRMLQ